MEAAAALAAEVGLDTITASAATTAAAASTEAATAAAAAAPFEGAFYAEGAAAGIQAGTTAAYQAPSLLAQGWSGLTSAAGAVGSAYTSVAPWMAGASLLLGSASRLSASGIEASSLSAQAAQQRFAAQQELLKGQFTANQVRQNLLSTIGQQNARYAAAGLDPGTGTPVTVGQAARDQAERELGLANTNATIAAGDATLKASALDTRATLTELGGLTGVATSLFDATNRTASRAAGTAKEGS